MRLFIKEQKGVSLIASAFLIIVLGFALIVGKQLFEIWAQQDRIQTTRAHLDKVQDALNDYLLVNGRYPCPASLTAPIDDPDETFGVESDCAEAPAAGTFEADGREIEGVTIPVRTGAVPVRTLGIGDEYIADGYGNRLIYAVTRTYAHPTDPLPTGDDGAISVIDGDTSADEGGNPATRVPGNIVTLVYSMGDDDNGTYTLNGAQNEECDPDKISGENCDFADNAVFRNSVYRSQNLDDPFQVAMTYRPSKIPEPCLEDSVPPPKNVAYLVDTSGSMANPASSCPVALDSDCRRIDVAHWAIRRLVSARVQANNAIEEPDTEAGVSSLTGFVRQSQIRNPVLEDVTNNLGNIVIDDPTQDGYTPPAPEDLNVEVENQLSGMCPRGVTPLGIHLEALAQSIEDGEENRPNKIVVISDGLSNRGEDPFSVAQRLATDYPNIEIDIIDVTGENAPAQQVTNLTGGTYYSPDGADEFLQALFNASGLCASSAPVAPTSDPQYCN